MRPRTNDAGILGETSWKKFPQTPSRTFKANIGQTKWGRLCLVLLFRACIGKCADRRKGGSRERLGTTNPIRSKKVVLSRNNAPCLNLPLVKMLRFHGKCYLEASLVHKGKRQVAPRSPKATREVARRRGSPKRACEFWGFANRRDGRIVFVILTIGRGGRE